MFKVNLFFVAILIVCALGVVTSQHVVRKLFMALEKEKEVEQKLEVEWGQLQLEQSAWSMHGRIEQIAKERLDMIVPAAASVQILSINAADRR